MDVTTLGDTAWRRGRLSVAARVNRLHSKLWLIGQCALAAGAAWVLANFLLGHASPFFAPIAAVVSLGTSYGQRLRRVAEMTAGVAVGIAVGDLFSHAFGRGTWQVVVVVALAMSSAILLDAGALMTTQAAAQAILVTTLLPIDGGVSRILDALIGGAVALVAATIVPGAPLRRPRQEAARVADELARLLALGRQSALDQDEELAAETLNRARETESLLAELRAASAEGLEVVRVSPLRRHTSHKVRSIAELVEPLDRALRTTRVLLRRVAVAARLDETMPPEYLHLLDDLAEVARGIATELANNRLADSLQPRLIEIGQCSATATEPLTLSAAVVLAQIRSLVVDLLEVCGMTYEEGVALVPPRP